MACVATLCLLDITWRRRCKAAPYGGSYARWRELPALGFRLICSGGGLAAVLMQHWLGSREAEPSDAGSGGSGVGSGVLPAVRDVVLLLFVSGLPAALQAWTWPLRIRWGTLAPCSPAYPPTAHSPALLHVAQAGSFHFCVSLCGRAWLPPLDLQLAAPHAACSAAADREEPHLLPHAAGRLLGPALLSSTHQCAS